MKTYYYEWIVIGNDNKWHYDCGRIEAENIVEALDKAQELLNQEITLIKLI